MLAKPTKSSLKIGREILSPIDLERVFPRVSTWGKGKAAREGDHRQPSPKVHQISNSIYAAADAESFCRVTVSA
jgi:hypothetical protein